MIRLRTKNKELESHVDGLKSHNRKFQLEMEQTMESLRQEAEVFHIRLVLLNCIFAQCIKRVHI